MPVAARAPSPLSQGLATGFDEFKMTHYTPPTTRFSNMVEDLEPRPIRNRDAWTLFYFDEHAHGCQTCHNPLAVHRRHDRLCREGTRLAENVAAVIFSKNNGSTIYYNPNTQAQRLVPVLIPDDYTEVLSLLRAFERSLRKLNNQTPIISYDRIYYVPARPVSTTAAPRVRRAPSPARAGQGRRPGDYRRSGILALPQEQGVPQSTRPHRSALRETNYRAPSVEDDGPEITTAPTPDPGPQFTSAGVSAAAAAASTTIPNPRPTSQAPPSNHTRNFSYPTAQPFQTRERQPTNTTTTPPSPRTQRQQTPSTSALPEAPEPPQRSERPEPTEFAFNTILRQPPTAQPRQSRSNRPARWRHSSVYPSR